MPLSSSQCTYLLPKNALLFPELPLLFSRIVLYFPEVPFCFMELPFCSPEAPFYFSKMSYCFPELPLVFQKCLCFIYYAHLFPRILFFQLIVPSCPAQSCFKRYLPCSCFVSFWNSLLANSRYLLGNLKTSTRSMIFYVLYSYLCLHEGFKNAVSEHLQLPQTSQLYRALSTAVQK